MCSPDLDCRASLQRLRELDPKNAEAALLEAGLMGRMGDARAHLAALQHAYESGGDPLSRLASSVAMTSLYHDGLTPQDVAALHRRLCAPIEASVKPKRDFSPERDLRDSAGLRESRDQGGQGEQGDRGDQGNPGQSGKSGIPGNPRQPGRIGRAHV